MLGIHKHLMQMHHDVVSIIVPRYPEHGREIYQVRSDVNLFH